MAVDLRSSRLDPAEIRRLLQFAERWYEVTDIDEPSSAAEYDRIVSDLQEMLDRHAVGLDHNIATEERVRDRTDMWIQELLGLDGPVSMDESMFFERLEYRLEPEVRSSDRPELGGYWCDGIVPDRYMLNQQVPEIQGKLYFGAPGEEQWTFTILLSGPVPTRDQLDWESLLPAVDEAGWLSVDTTAREVTIDLQAAQGSE